MLRSSLLLASVLALAASVPPLTAEPKATPASAPEKTRVQCFAAQRQIARAFRAYSQDARNPRKDVGSLQFFQKLVRDGFLEAVPTDPGGGLDSYGHFRRRTSGNGITCVEHGDEDTGSVDQKDACFAVQRTILDAIDSLGRGDGAPAGREIGTRKLFEKLIAKGHLQALPQDPGQGKESYKHFRQAANGAGIECSVHGAAAQAAVNDTERCWHVQASLAAAVDHYNLEKNVNRTDLGNKAFFQLLAREGYLVEVPQDPGQGPETFSNYRYTPDGNHVECSVHARPAAPSNQSAQLTPEN